MGPGGASKSQLSGLPPAGKASADGWAVGVAAAATVAIVILVQVHAAVIPVHVAISGSLWSCAQGGACHGQHSSQSEKLPAGPTERVTWTETNGDSLNLQVSGPLGPANGSYGRVCLWWNVSQGNCSFESLGGNYTIVAGGLGEPLHVLIRGIAVDFTFEYDQGL